MTCCRIIRLSLLHWACCRGDSKQSNAGCNCKIKVEYDTRYGVMQCNATRIRAHGRRMDQGKIVGLASTLAGWEILGTGRVAIIISLQPILP